MQLTEAFVPMKAAPQYESGTQRGSILQHVAAGCSGSWILMSGILALQEIFALLISTIFHVRFWGTQTYWLALHVWLVHSKQHMIQDPADSCFQVIFRKRHRFHEKIALQGRHR